MLIISKDRTQVLNLDNVIVLRVGEGDCANNIVADFPNNLYTWEEYDTPEDALAAMKALVNRIEIAELLGKKKPIQMPTDEEAQDYLEHEGEA